MGGVLSGGTPSAAMVVSRGVLVGKKLGWPLPSTQQRVLPAQQDEASSLPVPRRGWASSGRAGALPWRSGAGCLSSCGSTRSRVALGPSELAAPVTSLEQH